MVKRDKSPLLEASESLREYRESSEAKRLRKLQEAEDARARVENDIFNARENRINRRRAYSEFATNLKDELLGDALKGIYIGALSENVALTEEGLGLAESLMENYIKQSGGATAILSKISGKTYALDYIKSVVEGTYDSIMEDVDPDNEETQEVDDDKKEEMYNDLNQEEDIGKAVEVIAQRISDAEEEFIKKNNEDKKTIEDIANKVSERIKSVQDDTEAEVQSADSEEEAEEAKEEGEETKHQEEQIAKQEAYRVREKRSHTVFEHVVLNLINSIMKDASLREQYVDEDTGKIDMGSVIESAKCIYGLMETINTLQLTRVNAQYISEALSTM